MKLALKALVAGAALAAFATPAQADLVYLGNFSGQDCPGTGENGGGGFSACYATQTGIVYEPTENGSPSVYKLDGEGEESFSDLFPSIDGTEFEITFDDVTQVLSFEYTPDDPTDPALHYITVKQAGGGASGGGYALFFDAAGITSGSINLATGNNGDSFFDNPGYSHITFYDTGGPIPEPAVWGMMLVGFAGIGSAMRRRKVKPVVSFA